VTDHAGFSRGAIAAIALCVAGIGAAVALRPGPAAALPAVDGVTPEFSAPLDITNELLPFSPGAVTVYAGAERGIPTVAVDSHLAATRDFEWNGGTVSCRIVERLEFRRGVQVARERTFLAQADDGSVWAFGEVEEDEGTGGSTDDDDSGGWIVGQRGAEDPESAVSVASPALRMPAEPKPGDTWTAENVLPDSVTNMRVLGVREVLRIPVGRHTECVRVKETDVADPSSEIQWYAPEIGLVQTRAPRERLTLRASTLGPRR
jgi:hypothetical protein